MEMIVNITRNKLLLKKLILAGFKKKIDLYFSHFDTETDDIKEATYYAYSRSIADIYSEIFIDYHLKDNDVAETIGICLINEYLRNNIGQEPIPEAVRLTELLEENLDLSIILDGIAEDYDLFEILFKDFIRHNPLGSKDNGESKKFIKQ